MSQINVGFDNNSPNAIERSQGTLVAGVTTPYASVAAAIAAVNIAYRYRGKTVLIDTGTGLMEYWWRVDTQDASLVPKVQQDTYIDFIIGDGGPNTPAAGTTVYTNPAIVNCVPLSFTIEGAEIALKPRASGSAYATYNPTAGTITLTGTVFSTDGWYKFTFRPI